MIQPIRITTLALALVALAGASLANPDQWRSEFPKTDFTRSTIDLGEIISGGPPRDGIPALWDPDFVPVADEARLEAREPVMVLELDGQTPRAYPIRYLMWHEIVNDEIGGMPVAVTYCPLCNSAMVFERTVAGQVLSFGVSGKLRHSDMIMYDRETESWWQQAVGEGVVGEHAGTLLEPIPAWMESWADFSDRNPRGLVLDQPDWPRRYGTNPYQNYDTSARPFLYQGENPPHGIDPLARVVRVANRAWTFERLRREGRIAEAGVVLTWHEGQASALDAARIADGREVGTVRVRDAGGAAVVHDIPFAFAFHAFFPDGDWMLGD